jgi:hypothetical protein
MDVIFKNMSNKTISIQVDPNDKLESVVPKLMEQNEIDTEKNTIKFIFKGRVLNNSSTFQEFKDEKQLTIIYMVSKNKSESTLGKEQSLSNKPVTEVKIEPVQETSTNTNKKNWHEDFTSGENTNEVDRLRASVIATLFFIRQSPQFTELFMNNFTTLLDILSSDQLKPLFERIYNDTSEINDNEYIDNMTDHVSDVSSQSNDNLNDQDQHNIDTLVSLGFPKNASIQAYLFCNKNVELAASMLMDNN